MKYKCPNCESGVVIEKLMGVGATHLCKMCNHVGNKTTFTSTLPCYEDQKEEPICEKCQEPKANYIVNPYQLEINNKEIHEYLCDDCYNELLSEI